MARKRQPWFRFYVEAMSDPKLRRLDPAQRWLWTALMAAARQSPISGVLLISEREAMTDDDLADFAGVPVRLVTKTMPLFERAGMIDRDDSRDAWVVKNWAARQFESDDVTERTRRHRSKEPHRNVPTTFRERSGNGEGTVLGTPPESREQRTEAAAGNAVTSPPTPTRTAAADDLVTEALTLIAHRRMTGKAIDNPGGYIRGAVNGLRKQHAITLDQLDPDAFLTPEQLADWLEPPAPPKPPNPTETAQLAQRQQFERNARRCPDCDGTTWILDDDGEPDHRCPTCHGTGIAA